MSGHEHYLELGALAVIGQISADEDRELMQHLSECDQCREAYSDYSAILHNHLPNASPVRFRLKKELVHPAPVNEIRERFLARARSEGAQFSAEVEARKREVTTSIWNTAPRWLGWALAASAIATTVAMWTANYHSKADDHNELANLLRQNDVLTHELASAKQVPPRTIVVPERNDDRLPGVISQSQVLPRQLNQSKVRAALIESKLAALQSQNASLSSAHQQDQTQISDLQQQLAHERDTSSATIAALVEAQDKIRVLSNAANQNVERLAMERQLNAASSDVRQLMGARNLHIIDVHDVNAAGKSAKSFGRVFYSEGKSLVFYAFDLPASKAPARYVFKAWGQAEANERSVHDLGIFTVDDHEQRRWVLKVNDPQLLKGIDSVFVTAEATGDVIAPRGKRVLYAYLAGQANHP